MNTNQNQGTGPLPKAGLMSSLNSNEDSLLDGGDDETIFELRNENHELKTRCNNLEYEKNKFSISYENTIKELKQKYAIMERLLSQKSQKEDKYSSTSANKVQSKCQQLQIENEQLKRELQLHTERNRITPNFNAPQLAEDLATLSAYLQKSENFPHIQKGLDAATQQQLLDLKQKIVTLDKENLKLRQQVSKAEKQKEQMMKTQAKQSQENHNILRLKEKTIEELKKQQTALTLQLNESKNIITQLSNTQADLNSQQKNFKMLLAQSREKETKIVQLQENINRLEIQNNRIKSQKNKFQQESKFLQNQRKDIETKRKLLQEQLYKLSNETSQAKNSSFNEKFQAKKQYNALKYETEQEINRLKGSIENKTQSFVAMRKENQQLRQKQATHVKMIGQMNQQISSLKQKIDKLTEELQSAQRKASDKDKQASIIQQYQVQIKSLNHEVLKTKSQMRKSFMKTQQTQKQQSKLQEELRHKKDLIEILKIQNSELQGKIKQMQAKQAEKDKAISNLQHDIKIAKDDKNQLQIAYEMLREEKTNDLAKITKDVSIINSQLTQFKKQKLSMEEKRKEEEKLKHDISSQKYSQNVEKKQSKNFSLISSINFKNKDLIDFNEGSYQLPTLDLRNSDEGKEILVTLMKSLKAKNSDLQARIGQVQNERNQKAIDLSIKQSQLKHFKQQMYKPKQVNFEPFVQVSKKNQFNAIFFENKIMELQNQIKNIRSMKQKEIQQHKKAIRKQLQQKYLNEFKQQKAYIYELQKNTNILNSRNEQVHNIIQRQKERIKQLEQQNYVTKLELSNNLQQTNQILQQCKFYQKKNKQFQNYSKQQARYTDQYHNIKQSYDNINQNYQKQTLMLNNANSQIRKLNDVLMIKQTQLKGLTKSSFKDHSPRNSFIGGNRPQEKQHSMKEFSDHEKSESEVVRVWPQKRSGPMFTRI